MNSMRPSLAPPDAPTDSQKLTRSSRAEERERMAMKVKRSIAIAFERGKWGQMEEIDRATFPSEKPSDLALDGFVAVSFFCAAAISFVID